MLNPSFRVNSEDESPDHRPIEQPDQLDDEEAFDSIAQWSFLKPDVQPVEGEISSEPRTAIVMGPTTAGKTHLLKTIHFLFNNGTVPSSLLVGHGNTSTTAEVATYPLKVSTIHCQTVRTKDIMSSILTRNVHNNRQQIVKIFCGGVKNSRDFYLDEYFAKPKYGKKQFDFNFMDSPGCQDSFGRDEQHMMKLALALAKQSHISAIIFVIGGGMPYDKGFQTSFNYYWNWLKEYHGNFIVVHTKWDMLDFNFETSAKQRIQEFETTFPETAQVNHIFIDAKWAEETPAERNPTQFNQQKKAFAIEAINQLVNKILMMPIISCNLLQLRKTPAMLEVDQQLLAMARQGLFGAQQMLDTTESDYKDFNRQFVQKYTEIADLERQVKPLRNRLNEIDNENLSVLARKEVYIWHLWGFRYVELRTEFPIRNVGTEKTSSTVTFTDWTRTDFQLRVKVDSGNIPRIHLGDVQVCGYMRDVHASEIREIRRQLIPKEDLLQSQQKAILSVQEQTENKGAIMLKMKELIRANSLVISHAHVGTLKLATCEKIFEWYQTVIQNGGNVSDDDFANYKQIIVEED